MIIHASNGQGVTSRTRARSAKVGASCQAGYVANALLPIDTLRSIKVTIRMTAGKDRPLLATERNGLQHERANRKRTAQAPAGFPRKVAI